MRPMPQTERGNIFIILFAAVALIGLIGLSTSQFIRGPLTTATNVTRSNVAQTQMSVAAQLIIAASAKEASNGDCDGDNFIEPIDPRDPGAGTTPTGGGYIPNTIGASKKDPWGTEYGYCAWNHGGTLSGGGCVRSRIRTGVNGNGDMTVAVISAGRDKTFQTTCDDAIDTTPADNIADNVLVTKTGGSDDFWIAYTYSESEGLGGGLWYLKSGSPGIATIDKDVEIGTDYSIRFGDDARLMLPTDVELTDGECSGALASNVNDGALRLNTTTTPPSLEVCYDSDPAGTFLWDWGSAAGSGGGGSIDALTDGIADYTTLYNVFLGDLTGAATTTGTGNTALGYNAFNTNVAKSQNTAIGYEAMRYANSGAAATTYNTALGYQALRGSVTAASNTGTHNTAIGHSALRDNTNNNYRVAVGYNALAAGGAWHGAVAIGAFALDSATNGVYNTAVGYEAASTQVSADSVTAIGYRALRSATAHYNTCVGADCFYSTSSGNRNTGVGANSAYNNTIGYGNVAVGYGALYSNVSRGESVAIGDSAMYYAHNGSGISYNTAVGYAALQGSATAANNSGTSNTAIGHTTLPANTSGASNVAIGAAAASLNGPLGANTTGRSNVAIGAARASNAAGALAANTTGYENVAIGEGALSTNTEKNQSTAVGFEAMRYANSATGSTSTNNTALGYQALRGSTTAASNTGTGNTAIGHSALKNNDVGSGNTAVGYEALLTYDGDWGAGNTAIGYQALRTMTGGYGSMTAVGAQAMYSRTGGISSTAVGWQANYSGSADSITAIGTGALRNASNHRNTCVGDACLFSTTTSQRNLAMGSEAGYYNTTGEFNMAIGHFALYRNVTKSRSLAIGDSAMYYADNTALGGTSYNTAIGYTALMGSATAANNTGTSNTVIGDSAMIANTSGSNNIAIGGAASGVAAALGANTTGRSNVAIGAARASNAAGALAANTTGNENVAIGEGALSTNTEKTQSTAIGFEAMRYADSAAGGAVTYNTALGYQALRGSTTAASNTGTSNTAIGHSALLSVTTGAGNTAMGVSAGDYTSGAYVANTTGSNNTYVGYQAGTNNAAYSNSMALGYQAQATASNRIVLGNTSIADIYAQVTTITGISDARRKQDVHDIPLGLDFINKLRPVEYRYNNGDKTLRYGFIAQETEQALPENLKPLVKKGQGGLALLTQEKDKDKTYRMAYGELTAPLVRAVQEQQVMIENLQAKVAAQTTPAAGPDTPSDIARLERLVAILLSALMLMGFALGLSVLGNIAQMRRRTA